MTPFQRLLRFNNSYPGRKEAYQNMQKLYMNDKVFSGMFATTQSVIAADQFMIGRLISQGLLDARNPLDFKGAERVSRIKARNIGFGTRLFGTWRNSLGVYKLDDDVAEQAVAALIPDSTPSSIYTALPEWCVYITLPESMNEFFSIPSMRGDGESEFEAFKVVGFWATHDNIELENDQFECLDIFFNFEREDVDWLCPVRIPIKQNTTVLESLRMAYNNEEFEISSSIKVALSLLLWLCVEEPDVTNINNVPLTRESLSKPKYGKNKKTGAFVPPSQPIMYEIAKRLGGELREYQKQLDIVDASGTVRKRPHIRRGHWHGVWIGSAASKKFKLYWQHPLFVNAT